MTRNEPYRDRHEAGRFLANCVHARVAPFDPIVLALARGGVPVGLPVAAALRAPLDTVVVRKLTLPQHPDIAFGAIAPGGVEILDPELVKRLGLTPLEVAAIADRELVELQRREACYREEHGALDVRGRTILLVDDALASDLPMRAAICALQERHARRVLVAVPAGCHAACRKLETEIGELVCPFRLELFPAPHACYRDYPPTSDSEVCRCLRESQVGMTHEMMT